MTPIKHDFSFSSDRETNKSQFSHIPDGYIGVFTYELDLIFYVRDTYVYEVKKITAFCDLKLDVAEDRGWFRSKLFFKIEGEKPRLIEMFDQLVSLREKYSGHLLTLVNNGK